MANYKDNWIKVGYELFALQGIKGIVIESIAKKIGISKSSFYHHFVDIDIFIEELLHYHIAQSYIIAQKEQEAVKINPNLVDILVEHKIDLLFNKQLRTNRNNKVYEDVLIKSDKIIGNSFYALWVKDLGMSLKEDQLNSIFELSLDSFYLKITPENITKKWIISYFENLKKIINRFS